MEYVCVHAAVGIGHPLTSGGMAIDYTILSSYMIYSPREYQYKIADSSVTSAAECASATEGRSGSELYILVDIPPNVTIWANSLV